MLDPVQHLPGTVKLAGDVLSYSAVISAWLGVLSGTLTIIATLMTITWSAIRIYESKTVQGWLANRKSKGRGQE